MFTKMELHSLNEAVLSLDDVVGTLQVRAAYVKDNSGNLRASLTILTNTLANLRISVDATLAKICATAFGETKRQCDEAKVSIRILLRTTHINDVPS